MTNWEKYKDDEEFQKIIACDSNGFAVSAKTQKPVMCTDFSCDKCVFSRIFKCSLRKKEWLEEEYQESKEPEVDWSEVKVDTPILVRDNKANKWIKRYFAVYEDGKVHAFTDGATSWTALGVVDWKYAKLYSEEDK